MRCKSLDGSMVQEADGETGLLLWFASFDEEMENNDLNDRGRVFRRCKYRTYKCMFPQISSFTRK